MSCCPSLHFVDAESSFDIRWTMTKSQDKLGYFCNCWGCSNTHDVEWTEWLNFILVIEKIPILSASLVSSMLRIFFLDRKVKSRLRCWSRVSCSSSDMQLGSNTIKFLTTDEVNGFMSCSIDVLFTNFRAPLEIYHLVACHKALFPKAFNSPTTANPSPICSTPIDF